MLTDLQNRFTTVCSLYRRLHECRQNFTTYYTERAYVTLRKRVIQNAFVQQALEHSSQPDPGQTTSSHLLPLLTAK